MGERKRIALLMGKADDEYQSRFIRGFFEKAFSEGFDVCVFSMHFMYQNTTVRERGDANIFRLANPELFEAVVILSDTMQSPGVLSAVENELKKNFTKPVLAVDLDSESFPSVWTDGYTPQRKLIDHLIEVHHYTDIAFLTGKRWHPHSIQRLKAYEDSMRAHGLEVREDREFYGDFWYSSGEVCVKELLRSESGLPRAIACANDCMAIGVCQALHENDISIPDEVAVVGFDCTEEGRYSPVPLSSAYMPARSTGEHAAESIISMINGGGITEHETKPDVFIGRSCGCSEMVHADDVLLRDRWQTEKSLTGLFSLQNMLYDDLMIQHNLKSFLDVVYSYLYQINGFREFHLCLSELWMTPAALTEGRMSGTGYTERTLKALAAYEDFEREDSISTQNCFDTSLILPELHETEGKPKAYFFTPLFFESICLGYAAVSYGSDPRGYDDTYLWWVRAIMRGLECLRRTLLEAEDRTLAESGADVSDEERRSMEEVGRILDENRLSYFYQPIVSAVDGSIYAFEALMRAKSEMKISPLQIIKYATELKRLADVEKATFINVLTQVEEEEEAFAGRHVFINSIPGTRLDQHDYLKIESLLTKRGGQAVVELTEQAELNDNELSDMKLRFSRMGVGTAVDDYGTGFSNVTNLLRYMPDYVKVDRSLLSGIQDSPQKQHFVREIVGFSHDNNIKVLAEGVENSEELQTVIILGCDLIQGYYTGRPLPEVISHINEDIIEEIKRYQKQREDGAGCRMFEAGRSGRVRVSTLVKEGYSGILCTGGAHAFKDFTISGSPGQPADLFIEVAGDFDGQITLEKVHLSGRRHKPLIELSPGAKLTLVLEGENILNDGGIHVPEGAELVIQGEGDLTIQMNRGDYCAIGCAKGNSGKISFYQDGGILIDAFGSGGVAIGAGGSTDIEIHRGRYVVQLNGGSGVGIGSINSDVTMKIHDCEIDMAISCGEACGIGSYSGNADLDIQSVFMHCFLNGKNVVAAGSVKGNSRVYFKDMGVNTDIRADAGSGAGSVEGSADVIIDNVAYHFAGTGKNVYAYGPVSGVGSLEVFDGDVNVRLRNDSGKDHAFEDESKAVKKCRAELALNGTVFRFGEPG
ncbi:MAG: EAL domain-containing protein [Lachnospiraceae bacterium]|nr:EAL domain-containing protein [Lachnospiraceae bacterium]